LWFFSRGQYPPERPVLNQPNYRWAMGIARRDFLCVASSQR
jgi:hypothetical protein